MTTKILLVDDYPALLELLKTYFDLECSRVEIDKCTSAFIALEKVKCQQFDIIISDHVMRDMTGIELLKSIRAMGNSTPFVLFTAMQTPKIELETQEYGAIYIQKGECPIEHFGEIATMLRELKKK
jgi:two-component system, OmpR family, alkaline phosphatase synthesis response regulator PhoP